MSDDAPTSAPPPPPSAGFSLPPPEVSPRAPGTRRSLSVVAIGVVAIALGGFLTGIEQERAPAASHATARAAASAAPAPGYVDLRSMRRGPNAGLYDGAIESFEQNLPAPIDSVSPQTQEQRDAVLAARSERRAYDGAPPTIPHAIRADGAFECLACHDRGAVVAGNRAPAMSHERHDNCTQCHAPPSGLRAPPPPPLASNTFVGLAPASSGARAWPGAPPVIPHTTTMRSVCTSCHGVAGALGMRSTHPWRASCTQCHAPSSQLDQRPTNEGRDP